MHMNPQMGTAAVPAAAAPGTQSNRNAPKHTPGASNGQSTVGAQALAVLSKAPRWAPPQTLQ
jgi:hypothetical protein